MLARVVLVLCSLVLVLLTSQGTAVCISSGGCFTRNTSIPILPAGLLDENLPNRISNIRTGNDQENVLFTNSERCLPASVSYIEFRLNPQAPQDMNKIIRQTNANVFYFTRDSTTFYKLRI
jgi:hypothetical protein